MLKKYSNHFDHLSHYIPAMKTGSLLDIGSGKGKFLIQAAERGAKAYGIEYNPENIRKAKEKALELSLEITLEQGMGENLPFQENQFDFINMAELIEHVQDPKKLLEEVKRTLKPGAKAYMSVPTRYSLKDPHFHLYFVNWMPRSLCNSFISLFGKHKVYDGSSGLQKLDEMHYYTYAQIKKLVESIGLKMHDLRAMRIEEEVKQPLKMFAKVFYRLTRGWLFTTYHIILEKS